MFSLLLLPKTTLLRRLHDSLRRGSERGLYGLWRRREGWKDVGEREQDEGIYEKERRMDRLWRRRVGWTDLVEVGLQM